MKYWRKLFRNGIEWTYDLNSDIRVNLSDPDMIKKHVDDNLFIQIRAYFIEIEYSEGIFPFYFPNEDFCLYAKFPFEQMILVGLTIITEYDWPCTLVWLLNVKHFMQIDNNTEESVKIYLQVQTEIFEKCNYNER